ncbi:PucC family protein [Roseisolibacter sp. H3M3-2]|uniref:PucC family protein n=1 Tax=Roseisolibacter sp. H3M3-2 TaxID=3031323 RepID=UPI0023DA2296|nr:PucC family protein [Roseisolibacter sp. H3M3-2]MDF1501846.1 PucC family protein [Roseisolibacter sp. H3M3-2]
MTAGASDLRWRDVVRLGLAQVAIGAVAALMMSTLNRVMVVELRLPASVPSALVGLHFVAQLARARLGFASDRQRRRAPYLLGGALLLAAGASGAAAATALVPARPARGQALAALADLAMGLGLSAAGPALLALVGERVAPRRLGAVAAVLWIMMIFGIAASAGVTGALLDPFSLDRLLAVSAGVSVVVLALCAAAATSPVLRRTEGVAPAATAPARDAREFRRAVRAALAEGATRRFVGFVFLAMLAFSAQDLILEPFGGQVLGMTPGETTRLASLQHGGVLLGMIAAAWASTRVGSLRAWAVAGCLASSAAFVALSQVGAHGSPDALRMVVFVLGAANGVFTVGGVGSMMAITAAARGEAGLRLGIFGAAQGLAYGLGGFAGGAASDVARWALGSPAAGYAAVFAAEAVLFAGAAWLAARSAPATSPRATPLADGGDALVAVLR